MTSIIRRFAALLLLMCVACTCALSEQAYTVSAINADAADGQLDLLVFSDAPVRSDTISILIDGNPLSGVRVQPAASSGDGCSYLVIVDMPRLKYEEHETKLLRSYKETLSFLIGNMRDSDNALLLLSGGDTAQLKPEGRAAFFDRVQALDYTRTPDTLNQSIAAAAEYLMADNDQLCRRTCIIVLTDAQMKDPGEMPEETLTGMLSGSGVCVYAAVSRTTGTKDEQTASLERIAKASTGGMLLACARDADENERKLMQMSFLENEERFHQVGAPLDGLTQENEIASLEIIVEAEGRTGKAAYALTDELRGTILAQLPPPQEETPDEETKQPPYMIIGAGALGVLVLAVLLIAAKKKKKPQPAPEKAWVIQLRMAGPDGEKTFEGRMPDVLVFGRDPARANVVLVQDKKVSGVHARMTFDGMTMRLEDCGSTNGTFLNGMPISAPCVLQQGDEIGMGRTAIQAVWRLTEV